MAINIETFLAKLSDTHLHDFAAYFDVQLDEASEEPLSKQLLRLSNTFPKIKLGRIRSTLMDVKRTSSDDRIHHFYSVLNCHPDIVLPLSRSSEDRALWLRLNHPTIFEKVQSKIQHSRWAGKDQYWNGFQLPKDATCPSTLETPKVKAALRDIFEAHDKTGKLIKIRIFDIPSQSEGLMAKMIAIYREALPETHTIFEEQEISTLTFSPCISMTVIIDEHARLFEITSKTGGKRLRSKVATVLLEEMSLDPNDLESAKLRKVQTDVFKKRISLAPQAEDGVNEVRFVECRFYDEGGASVAVNTFESNYDDVWHWAEENGFFDASKSLKSDYIANITLQFSFNENGEEVHRKAKFYRAQHDFTMRGLTEARRKIVDEFCTRLGLLERIK